MAKKMPTKRAATSKRAPAKKAVKAKANGKAKPAKKAKPKEDPKPKIDPKKAEAKTVFTEPETDFEPPDHPAVKKQKVKPAKKATTKQAKPEPAPEPEPDVRWKDLVPGASTRWVKTADGYHVGNAPAKRAMCPGCTHFLPNERLGQGLCNSGVNEATRQKPTYTHCMHARQK